MTNSKHLMHRSLDIGSGLIISIIIQLTIFPLYGIYIEVWAMFHLAIIFTIVGIIRSYLWSKYVFKYGESK
jgi:multisubunit Na+/H+ antiporter MnhF subunit